MSTAINERQKVTTDKYRDRHEEIFGKKELPKGGKFRFVRGKWVPIKDAPPTKALPNGDTQNVTNVALGFPPNRLNEVLKMDPKARGDVDFTDTRNPVFKNIPAMERHIEARGWSKDHVTHG